MLLFVRILAILFLVRLALRALAGRRRVVPPAPRGAAGGDLVRDRVCNTFVPRDRALQARLGQGEEFFCSSACRDRALAESTTAGLAP